MNVIVMSLTLSLGNKWRLLAIDKRVCSFLSRCKKGDFKTSVRVPLHSVYFSNLSKFNRSVFNPELTGFGNIKGGKCISVFKLQHLMGCTRKEAQTVLLKCPGLAYINENDLLKNLELLKLRGISLSKVQEHPWLLTFTPDSLGRRLSLIETFKFENINDAVPLMQIALPRLSWTCSLWKKELDCFPGGSRMHYISEELKCPLSVVCDMMVKYSFLRMLPASRLKKNLDLMISAGVSPSNILKDLWSLRTRSEMVEKRLRQAKEAGLPVLKPWLVRCQEQIFHRTLERHVQSHALLGSKSFYEFLADRLNCDVQTVEVMTARYPNILHVNIPKINEIVDFLTEEGFSMEQIQQVPRILCHSLETTRARLKQLLALGFNPVSLMVLCQSQHEYHKLVHKLELRKKRVAL